MSDLSKAADLWAEMFKDDSTELVAAAVKSLITTLEFPPTIADVKNEMYKLTKANEGTAIDEWNAIKKAISNSAYYSVECFENLPPLAKKFVGSPNQLRQWAIDEDFNDGVIRGQFLKQYEVLKEREKHDALMPNSVKALISQTLEKQKLALAESQMLD